MRRLLLSALVLAFTAGLSATVIVPIEFRELVTTSSVIVQGRVTDVRSALVNGRQSVETFVTVEAARLGVFELVEFRFVESNGKRLHRLARLDGH